MMPPPVSTETTQALARLFPGVSGNRTVSDTTHAGTLRYTDVNTATGRELQQYVASGGFFVYNSKRAFSEQPGAELNIYTPNWVCNFLASKQLFPAETEPLTRNCNDPSLPYDVTPIYLSVVTPSAALANGVGGTQAISSLTQIGVVYHVPLAVNVTAAAPHFIPLGGPGGHLSILLTGFGDQESLDPQWPGINAVASPWYNRTLERQGDYPEVPVDQAIQSLRSVAPGAVITPGNPVLEYYVGDPAEPQPFIMPMWHFPDAMANVGGQEVNLRGVWVPGIDGFLPGVHITVPPDGSTYFPGRPVTVTGVISGSAGPFNYALTLEDGSPLKSGVAPSGTLHLLVNSLPLFNNKGQAVDIRLQLTVTDTNGASSQDSVMLHPPRLSYLPIVMRNAGMLGAYVLVSDMRDVSSQGRAPDRADIVHSMGVEFVRYYNGTNPDLSGVPPDGNGYYSGLASAGWSGAFYWANNSAWERDWRDCSLGGSDCTYGVDRAEFAYFSGHGSPARIYFGTNINSYNFFGGNARYQNVRWAGFSSCQTLRAGPYVSPGNPPLTNWFNAFQGAYMLLGFHSNMADIAFGGPLVDNMRVPLWFGFLPQPSLQLSVREAWVQTAFAMNAGDPAYLYAVGAFDPVNFRLPDPSRFVDYFTSPLSPGSIYQFRWVWWG
jgi:hypothetical protein